jgi:hypothetical protein
MKNIEDIQQNLTEKIIKEIDSIAKNSSSYIDAIIFYCEKNEIEIEDFAAFVKENVKLKSLIKQEAENLNFIEKTARLFV